jgi:hypothetical protein
MKFTIETYVRGVDYSGFESAYFSDAFNCELSRAVNLKERVVTGRELLDDTRERISVHVVPRVALPNWLQKVVRKEIAYDEITVFDRMTRTGTLEIASPAGERVAMSGELRILEEPLGVHLRVEAELRVRVLGLGSIIERFVVTEIKRRFVLVEETLQRFIDTREQQVVAPLRG